MKKIFIVVAALISLAIFAFSYPENSLVGRWEGTTRSGTILGADFKPDHTYVGYADEKVFVTGKYQFKANILSIDDDADCKTTGIYKITFFADSIRFAVVTDSCSNRRQEIDKIALKSVKKK